jgi:hypothetical protein
MFLSLYVGISLTFLSFLLLPVLLAYPLAPSLRKAQRLASPTYIQKAKVARGKRKLRKKHSKTI